MKKSIAIIGGGPAGLMAAEVLIQGGMQVDLYEAMPSLGRKFLMAGKSGQLLLPAMAVNKKKSKRILRISNPMIY